MKLRRSIGVRLYWLLPFLLILAGCTRAPGALGGSLSVPAPVEQSPAAAPLAPFTVGGWNTGLDDADPQVIAALLADYAGVDLWGLAEVNDSGGAVSLLEKAAEAGEDADFRAVLGRSGDAMRLLALYNAQRYDLLDQQELDSINTTGNARAPLVLHLRERAGGQEFLFMVNHLYRSRAGERLRQAELLAQWAAAQTLPVIAVGDYNLDWTIEGGERDHDPAYTALTANNVWDWVRPANLVTTQCSGWPCTYNTVLDFVFTAGPARDWPGRSRIVVIPGDFPDDTRRSDHRAVLAQFAPGGAEQLAGEIVLSPEQMPVELLGGQSHPSAVPTSSVDANLRAGPSMYYPILGGTVTGQRLENELAVIGQSEDGLWLALANGSWILGELVIGAPAGLRVVTAPDLDVMMATVLPAFTTPDPQAHRAAVIIVDILYDGVVPETESDEYIMLRNQGTEAVNLGGWRVNAGSEGQDFWLPDYRLPPGADLRIYTGELHPPDGTLSFGSRQPIWRNSGDCGYLYDRAGTISSEYCY